MPKKFTLVGPHAGKTIRLGKYEFVDGVHMFEGSEADALLRERVLSTYYSAYSDERLPYAREAFERLYGVAHEPASVVSEAEDRAAADAAKRAADDAAKRAADEAAKQAAAPPSLAEIVQALDPKNDEHWTSRGLPSMEAIEKIAGKAVSREDVEKAAPGFTRTKAQSAADPLE